MTTELSTSQTMVLSEILKILRNDEYKIARKKIYELFMEKKIDDINSLDKQTILFIEKLNGDFDEIGFLVEEFKIKEILFKLYSDTIRRIWIALRINIENEKIKRQKNDPAAIAFGYYFNQLAYEAKKYRDKNNLKEPGFTDLRE